MNIVKIYFDLNPSEIQPEFKKREKYNYNIVAFCL